MRYFLMLFGFMVLFSGCSGTEDEIKSDEITAETNYCDCNELAFDQPYNRFYLTVPKEWFTGICENYHGNGNLALIKHFEDGKIQGEVITYYENGQIESTKHFEQNLQTGEHKKFDENGDLMFHATYKNGRETEIIFIRQ